MNQRGVSETEIKYVLENPIYTKKGFEDRKEAVGEVKGRNIKVVYIEKEKYIKIITII